MCLLAVYELTKPKGSDHCPVYAVIKDAIAINGVEHDLRDVMNPPEMFLAGKRQREYSTASDLLPLSGKLIPEFLGRRNIRDMFARKPSLPQAQSSSKDTEASRVTAACQRSSTVELPSPTDGILERPRQSITTVPTSSPFAGGRKRSAPATTGGKIIKRGKSGSATATMPVTDKGQQSLKGFFKSSVILDSSCASTVQGIEWSQTSLNNDTLGRVFTPVAGLAEARPTSGVQMEAANLDSATHTPREIATQHTPGASPSAHESSNDNYGGVIQPQENFHDPVESKESWRKLFKKPAPPRCEGHDEPCISLLTKKPGMNLGRSFWMCQRPLGPSGAKEKNTQWRCQTFIWCSDWNPNLTNG